MGDLYHPFCLTLWGVHTALSHSVILSTGQELDMKTLQLEAVEASSGPGFQPRLNVPMIPTSWSSYTNPCPSKDKPKWLKCSMTKVRGCRSSQHSKANSNWFWWAIAAAITSIFIIAALVAILCVYNGHAAPPWLYGIIISNFRSFILRATRLLIDSSMRSYLSLWLQRRGCCCLLWLKASTSTNGSTFVKMSQSHLQICKCSTPTVGSVGSPPATIHVRRVVTPFTKYSCTLLMISLGLLLWSVALLLWSVSRLI